MPRRTRVLAAIALAAVAVTALLLLVVGPGRGGTDPAPGDAANRAALARLAALREAVDGCTAVAEAERARFEAHQARVDSLRAVVLDYESAGRTVAAERFEAYMEAFDAYNAAVAAWDDRAAALESHWAACRALAERHNALVDSLGGGPPPGASPPLASPAAEV